MILDLAVLLVLLVIIWLVNVTGIGAFFTIGDHASLAFGFILLSSYVCGRVAKRAKLPMITGYLIAGMVFGPYLIAKYLPSLGILTKEVIASLELFETIALGLIAFSAGGEMKMDMIRERLRSILTVAGVQTLVVFVFGFFGIMLIFPFFDLFASVPHKRMIGTALLLAVVSTAKSPASTIALILEFRSRGPLTTSALGVTVVKDVLVLVLFSFAMIGAKLLFGVGGSPDTLGIVLTLSKEVFGSLGIGLLVGFIMARFMHIVDRELPMILLALSFVAMKAGQEWHLSGLLICMVAGFYVENWGGEGDRLIRAIDHFSLPIFVLFFTITGAKLQLNTLVGLWPVVLVLVLLRLAVTFGGTWLGSRIAGDPPMVRKNLWMAFVTQAGVSLGLASIIAKQIPGIGDEIRTIIVAAVAVNQIIGPIAFRYALLHSGEAGKGEVK